MLEIERDDTGAADKVAVTGDAYINDDIKILPAADIYVAGQRYTIINTGRVIHTIPSFDNLVQGNALIFNRNIIYSANKVELEVPAAILSYLLLSVNRSSNTCEVAEKYINTTQTHIHDSFHNTVLKEISSLMIFNSDKAKAFQDIVSGKRYGLVAGNYQFYNTMMNNVIR